MNRLAQHVRIPLNSTSDCALKGATDSVLKTATVYVLNQATDCGSTPPLFRACKAIFQPVLACVTIIREFMI